MPRVPLALVALCLAGSASAEEPARAPVPEVGQVYETTRYSAISFGRGIEQQVTAPNGPTRWERGFIETFPPEWEPQPANPHGSYGDVPVGALVECVAVNLSTEPWDIVSVVWWAQAPEGFAGTLFVESYAVERAPSTVVFLDGATLTDHAPAFDGSAWRRAAKGHPKAALGERVARPR